MSNLNQLDVYKKLKLNTVKHNFFENIYNINLPNFDNYPEAQDEFLDMQLFSSYLATILLFFNINSDDKNKVCLYNSVDVFDIVYLNTLDYFININFIDWKINIPTNAFAWVNTHCANNENVNLYILPIRLDFVNTNVNISSDISCTLEDPLKSTNIDNNMISQDIFSAHSNVIIIDKLLKKIEFYEPHGVEINIPNAKLFNIQTILEKTIRSLLPFTMDYTFVNVSNICPYGRGAQSLQSQTSEAGHCLAWSLYFILLRLYNQQITTKLYEDDDILLSTTQILNHYVTTSSNSILLNSNIRKFISFLKDLSSNNSLLNMNDFTNNFHLLTSIDIIENNLINNLLFKERIVLLTQAFLYKSLTFDNDKIIIFEELITYRNFNNFQKIIFNTIVNYIKNNMICFLQYERINKILHPTDEWQYTQAEIENLTNIYLFNLSEDIDNTMYLNNIFNNLISYRLDDGFYTIFFKRITNTILDSILLNTISTI